MARKMHLNMSRERYGLENIDENKVDITSCGSNGVNRARVIRMLCRPGLLLGSV